jgi:ABC-type polysaccharide/polyol phosphate transport system ATPase subunit
MNGSPAVEFDHVWKRFPRHGGRLLLRAQLKQLLSQRSQPDPFYALKDISFRVHPGESVAIIGANGAGKSTLLSLVAGLAPPDAGRLAVRGIVAPLLELAAGFHGDLTGAENLRLNASLLGIGRKQVSKLTASIVDFSELGDFIDEPLRTYSSGMVTRLAFSIAVNIDPDVLLIDEILAVGDTAFQAKCFDRVLDFRRKGKTILCVSHATEMVKKLADRALWLDHGDLMVDGPLQEVADAYSGRLQAKLDS